MIKRGLSTLFSYLEDSEWLAKLRQEERAATESAERLERELRRRNRLEAAYRHRKLTTPQRHSAQHRGRA